MYLKYMTYLDKEAIKELTFFLVFNGSFVSVITSETHLTSFFGFSALFFLSP